MKLALASESVFFHGSMSRYISCAPLAVILSEVEGSLPSFCPSVPSVVKGLYFSVHSGTRPGVQGAPAASMSFSSFTRSTSASVRNFAN